VSIDEIEGRARDFSPEPPSLTPTAKVEQMTSGLPADSPPLEEVEEILELEPLDEVEVPLPPVDAVSSEAPASLRIFSAATAQPGAREPVPAVDAPVPAPPPSFVSPPDAGSRAGDAELREFFAGRAAEIFRTVASEAVEKVMWEMTDRLAAEFSAKLRESIEAVAWEVIPSTAEALIREEIARVRGQAGKPSS
jgi:hypothetical protein